MRFSPPFVLCVSVAVVGAFATLGSASAAPRASGDAGQPAARGRIFDPAVHARPIDARRGPFFGLRVHSMDVAGDAENVACFEYFCDGLRPGVQREAYDLVRTAYRVSVVPTSCDEVMGLPLPPNADVRRLRGVMGQTRWMRRQGPGGTPVGGFVGSLHVDAIVGPTERAIPMFDFHLAGTTGLRPMRGDSADASPRDDGRCTAPRHDEGWYVGDVNRKALIAFARELGDREGVPGMLRTLDRSILAGTFEGQLDLGPNDVDRLDYCDITRGAWWFDGLLAWDCRAVAVKAMHEHEDAR